MHADELLPVLDCSLPLAADRARMPPTSSSLADKKHVDSLLLSTTARDPQNDGGQSVSLCNALRCPEDAAVIP